jgi:hypothetical protein
MSCRHTDNVWIIDVSTVAGNDSGPRRWCKDCGACLMRIWITRLSRWSARHFWVKPRNAAGSILSLRAVSRGQ